MIDKNILLARAIEYLQQGFNVIAVDENKKAVWSWNKYENETITAEEIGKQIAYAKTAGIAIVCGQTSGNLEVIDLDADRDITGSMIQRYYDLIPASLRLKLRIHKTRSGGRHLLYRCEVIEGNKKLASRPATEQEKKDNPHVKVLCLTETRGQGGYIAAPPMDGYSVAQDVPVPVISVDEREILLEAARSLHEDYKEDKALADTGNQQFAQSPYEDYNQRADVVELLIAHGWTKERESGDRIYMRRPGTGAAPASANYSKERRLLYVWSTSTDFEAGKAYTPSGVYATLEHAGNHQAAAKALIKAGYGQRATPASVRTAIEDEAEIPGKFWEVKLNKDGSAGAITINAVKLGEYLNRVGGFTNYKYNDRGAKLKVRVQDGMVNEVDKYDIRQFVMSLPKYLPANFDAITPIDLVECLVKNPTKYLNEDSFDYLPKQNLQFLKDTPTSAYFPFLNGVVEVTAEGPKLHKYSDFDGYIWGDDAIKRDIIIDPNPDFTQIDYCQFVRKTAGEDQKKFEYFMSAIGYLLHKYKDPRRAWAVILAEETENEGKGGGTGKGLFMKGVRELVKTDTFDGKNFDTQKGFSFQRVTLATKVISIEDVSQRFNFESIYSMITEGLTVEKKNKPEQYIDYQDSPKFVISTNYGINDAGNHAQRRVRVLEFSNYFGLKKTPYSVFGKQFFSDDWKEEDWNRFYNFMFTCVQVYLENPEGVASIEQSDTNKVKNVSLKYGEQFLTWFTDYISEKREPILFKDLFQAFLDSAGMSERDYKRLAFSKAMSYTCQLFKMRYETSVTRIEGKAQTLIRILPQD